MARRVEIKINMDNAAFDENEGVELARILRKLANCVDNDLHVDEVHLRDVNGNTVGIAKFIGKARTYDE